MGGTSNLTTLEHVKQWLAIDDSNTNSDVLLNRLIRAASAFVLNYIQRDSLALAQYDDVYDGYGNNFMVLRQFPVTSIVSLSVLGTPLRPAQGNGQTEPFRDGYILESSKSVTSQQRVTLFGHRFPRQKSSVAVSYMAGYVIETERHIVPDDTPYTVSTTFTWLEDVEVTLVDGTPLTYVDGAPASGQYTVSASGVYAFNSDLAGDDVLISYSYVPADIEQAVFELVGERYKTKDRIGYVSKSLGGQETVTFDVRSMNPYIRELLQPYTRVVPV